MCSLNLKLFKEIRIPFLVKIIKDLLFPFIAHKRTIYWCSFLFDHAILASTFLPFLITIAKVGPSLQLSRRKMELISNVTRHY